MYGFHSNLRNVLFAVWILAVTPIWSEQDPSEKPSKVPPGRETYKGRTIAQTMHYAGADWLVRAEREREENVSLMIEKLGLQPGMVVCDLGCGNGYHALKMAQRVGENGRVVAVDIQAEMLDLLRQRMEQNGTENVIPILGSVHNPRLPVNSVDLVLLVDVYHELSHPELVLRAIRQALKPDGILVLVEFRTEDPLVPIKPLHKMSKAQIMKEIPPNGFKLDREFDELPWQHMMFFKKDAVAEDPGKADMPDDRNTKSNERDQEYRSAGSVRRSFSVEIGDGCAASLPDFSHHRVK